MSSLGFGARGLRQRSGDAPAPKKSGSFKAISVF